MKILFLLFAVMAGAFGAAAIRLLFEEPRKLQFIVVALVFLALGMRKSPYARSVLQNISDKDNRQKATGK